MEDELDKLFNNCIVHQVGDAEKMALMGLLRHSASNNNG